MARGVFFLRTVGCDEGVMVVLLLRRFWWCSVLTCQVSCSPFYPQLYTQFRATMMPVAGQRACGRKRAAGGSNDEHTCQTRGTVCCTKATAQHPVAAGLVSM